MSKKIVMLVVLNLIIIGVAVALIAHNSQTPLAPQELEECKTLQFNSEEKVDIVFFSNKDQAEEYSDALFEVSPIKNSREDFNIYYIDSYAPECEIYKGKALLCYNKEMIRKASSCPNDYIIIPKKEDSKIRSSAYMNLVSINTKNPTNVLAHEFGHVFANLADEYVPAILPKSSKNCVKTCEEFDQKDGCFQGCAEEDYQRSISEGLMRTLSSMNYGVFNENIILGEIDKIKVKKSPKITGSVIEEETSCLDKEYFLIEGEYLEDRIEIKSKSIEQGCAGDQGTGDLKYNLILKDDSIIKEDFNPIFIFTDGENKEEIEGEVFISEKEFFIKIQKYPGLKLLNIENENEILAEINLADLSEKTRPCKK